MLHNRIYLTEVGCLLTAVVLLLNAGLNSILPPSMHLRQVLPKVISLLFLTNEKLKQVYQDYQYKLNIVWKTLTFLICHYFNCFITNLI